MTHERARATRLSMTCNFILYVQDQKRSTQFYGAALGIVAALDVPGMTEFHLAPDCILGLMPEAGIKRLLGDAIEDPQRAHGVPRAELYLRVDQPRLYLQRAVEAGAKLLSAIEKRSWGDEAGYLSDPDGHVIAFARRI